ncbi:MAG: hypothetical protein COA57_04175 [Flavobacteriales bacterium]|nr:MAG: hypothetical protein COA57_04175 [Flavobacteriales bacterium]
MENKKRNIFIAFVIAAVTFSVYFHSLEGELVNYDDFAFITSNRNITALSVENAAKHFTTQNQGHYHPITWMSFTISYHFFKFDSKAYHAASLLFHLLNVLLVFVFVQKLTGKTFAASIVSFLFAVHPMNVESVAWVSGHSSVVYSFFYLLAIISYIYYLRNGQKLKHIGLCFLLFLCSVLSKSAGITLPAVLLLLDFYFERKVGRKALLEKIPFFVFTIVFGVIAVLASKQFGSLMYGHVEYNWFDRIFLIGYALSFYIVKLFVPFQLCSIHYNPVVENGLLPFEYYIAPVFMLVIIAGIYLIIRKRGLRDDFAKKVVFGFVFYLITISMVSQVVPLGNTVASERYTYLPCIGVFFIVALAFQYYVETRKRIAAFAYIGIAVCGLMMIYITWNRIKAWNNSFDLYSDVVKKYPDRGYGYFGLGLAKLIRNDVDGALADLNIAIEHYPQYHENYNGRGNAKQQLGDYEGAIQDYDKAIELKRDFFQAYINRGNAKVNMHEYEEAIRDFTIGIGYKQDFAKGYGSRALVKMKIEDYKGALLDYIKAIELQPENPAFYFKRGKTLLQMEQFQNAVEDLSKAIELLPDYYDAYVTRGRAKIQLKDCEGAVDDCSNAINTQPSLALAYVNRGVGYNCLQQYENAIADFDTAIEISPDESKAYANRGISKAGFGKYPEAIDDYKKAIETDLFFAGPYMDMANLLFNMGEYENAIANYNRFLQLEPENIQAYIYRGMAKKNAGDISGACDDWKRANANQLLAENCQR